MNPSPLAAIAALAVLSAIILPLLIDAICYHRSNRRNRK